MEKPIRYGNGALISSPLSQPGNSYVDPVSLSLLCVQCPVTSAMATTEQETTKNGLSLVFSYGTLKSGFQNHVLMEELKATGDASFKGVYTTMDAFPLVIGPYGIPFLINKPRSGHHIPGELYSVTGRGLARLDELEGIETGHYERLPVKVVSGGGEVVTVEAYFAHRSFAEELWRKCGEVGVREYSMQMGNQYVKRSNRPLGSTFVGEVWKFISNAD